MDQDITSSTPLLKMSKIGQNRGFFIRYPLIENVKNLSKSKVLYRITPYCTHIC